MSRTGPPIGISRTSLPGRKRPGIRLPGVLLASALLGSTLLASPLATSCAAQSAAQVREESTPILTYPYSDPDPVPMLVKDRRLYPYHSFDGLTNEPEMRNWDVVVLENELIKVFVLPAAGGKVWGAIEKSSGQEFIYRNEVMKFRNIALRGPWTSGGIEFNFGVIGHTPSTAAPVDFTTRVNDDGSVSCFVGMMDLPSRTQWRVEIRLEADKAYFETRATWYNPTPVEQPYYNWMTAAAFATDDLVMSIPGDEFLQHSGRAMPWPVDAEGRDLSIYANNQFDSHKSYHVVGEYNDFFGGYYTNSGYGFGHWAEYSDMPGQKLWLWSLARDGGIWEDLLTDSDGQYVEFQAGRLFVQYSPGADDNPITQAGFEPYRTDQWTERWFPVIGIGGLTDASASAAMSVTVEGPSIRVGLNPFASGSATLLVMQSDSVVLEKRLDFAAMEVVRVEAEVDPEKDFEVIVEELDLHFRSNPKEIQVDRPFDKQESASVSIPKSDRQFFAGRELMKARWYKQARARFDSLLVDEPWHFGTLLAVAELDFRAGRYEEGLVYANRARQLDAYSSQANYVAAILYRAIGDFVNAREAFGWALRSTAYRSVAHAQLAEVSLIEGKNAEAIRSARQALDFDRYSMNALEVLVIAARKSSEVAIAKEALEALVSIDPLSHFAAFEMDLLRYRDAMTFESLDFEESIRNEFPEQTYVELGISYYSRGQVAEASLLFGLAVRHADSQLASLWLAWLKRELDPGDSIVRLNEAIADGLVSARPYRSESIPVMEWLANQDDRWQWKYLLALNYWAVDRDTEAAVLMTAMADAPDDPTAYIARANLLKEVSSTDLEADLRKALETNDSDRRTWLHLHRYYENAARHSEALALSEKMVSRFGDSFVVRLAHTRSLLRMKRPRESLELLNNTNVLPAEGAGGGRELYASANIAAGLEEQFGGGGCTSALSYYRASLEWPEHLGQGRPYTTEERLSRFLIAGCLPDGEATTAQAELIEVASARRAAPAVADLLTYQALLKLNREEDARQLLDDLAGVAGSNPIAAWVLSRIRKDGTESEILDQYPLLVEMFDRFLVGLTADSFEF